MSWIGPTQGFHHGGGAQPTGLFQSGGASQPCGGIQPAAGYPLFHPGHSGWYQSAGPRQPGGGGGGPYGPYAGTGAKPGAALATPVPTPIAPATRAPVIPTPATIFVSFTLINLPGPDAMRAAVAGFAPLTVRHRLSSTGGGV